MPIFLAVYFFCMYQLLHRFRISHYISKHFLTVNFLPFKCLYWLLSKVSITKTIHSEHSAYKVFVKDGVGWMNLIKNYESWFENLLDTIQLSEETVFVDVGANIGQTMLKVLSRNPSVQYIGVEPNQKCLSYLGKLVMLNGYSNVRLFNFALSDQKGETSLLLRFDDDLLATTSPSFRKYTNYAKKETVKEITGDELLKSEEIEHISIIKVDVEGGEAGVLLGLKQTIRKFRPIIICEVLPLHSKSEEVSDFRHNSARQILDIAKEMNYQMYNIQTISEVKSVNDISASLEAANYIFLPADKFTDLRRKLHLV